MGDELLSRLITEMGIQVKGFDKALKDLDELKIKTRAAGASADELSKLDVKSLQLAKQTYNARQQLERMNKTLAEQAAAAAPARSAIASLSDELTGLVPKLGALGIAGAAVGAAKGIVELHQQAAKTTAILGNLKISIDEARDATHGLVSDTDLARNASVAHGGLLRQTAEEYAALTGAVTNLALAQGREVVPTIERVTEALAKGETAELAKLGISLESSEQAHYRYAKSIGVTVDQLDDQQKKLAQSKSAMERLLGASADIEIQTENLGTRWDQFTIALGRARDEMTSNAYEVQQSRNEIGAWDHAVAGAKDQLLRAIPGLESFANHQDTLNKKLAEGTAVERGLVAARELRNKITDQTIRKEMQLAKVAEDAAKSNAQILDNLQKAKKESDKKLREEANRDTDRKIAVLTKYPQLKHLVDSSPGALEAAARQLDKETDRPRGGKREKKEEFHLTDFEQLLQRGLGSGFKIGDIPIRQVKMDPDDIRPQSVVNVTNIEVGGIQQEFPNATGVNPKEMQEAAMAAAASEFDKRLNAARNRSRVPSAR